AWEKGARLDGWSEHFDLRRWQQAAEECQLDLDSYLRRRTMDEVLPWQHLQSGVELQFLQDEWENALAEHYTPDCRYHNCQECGLCDFDTIFPIVHNRSGKGGDGPPKSHSSLGNAVSTSKDADESAHFKYLVHYKRTGKVAFLGHLEILQIIFRALRRAKIDTNFSQGFNPSPKISFGPALSVGTESFAEFFTMDLPAPLKDTAAVKELLNTTLIPGLEVTGIELHSGKIPQKMAISYNVILTRPLQEKEKIMVQHFIDSGEYSIDKTRKGKTKSIDIRPLILKLEITGNDSLQIQIISASAQPGIKIIEAITAILKLTGEEVQGVRIIKTGWHQLD
ncbi:MAG: TIGR03936 family radical SAM-associated protein, partial [Desulforhopalus sp.]